MVVLWHEPSNHLAVCEIRKDGGLPLMFIVDNDFNGINPFYAYPLNFLKPFGWHEIGEL